MPHGNEERRVVSDLSTELQVDLTDEDIETVLETATELMESVEVLSTSEESSKHVHQESYRHEKQDEYNAFLDVYDEPLQRTDKGRLGDVVVGIKDVIAVRDLHMTCGSRSFSYIPSDNATIVERLLDDGVSIVGKTNSDAFAFGPTGEFSEFGKVINPVDETRVPGGSSSGSAVAVAGDIVDAAIGTDTGGSIRIPAACCGVVGVKPTHGFVPRYGFFDLAPSTDVIGPITNDVDTAARILEVIAGPETRDPSSSNVSPEQIVGSFDELGDLHVGLPTSLFDVATPDVAAAVREASEKISTQSGVAVDTVELQLQHIEEAYPLTLASEFAWLLRQAGIIHGQGTKYSEEWREIFQIASRHLNKHIAMRVLPAAYLDVKTSGRSYVLAREEALDFKERLNELFETYDILLFPTIRGLPPTYEEITATEGLEFLTGNTAPISLVGNPAVSVPVGEVNGLPVSAQVVSQDFQDGVALYGAKLLETMAN